MIVEFKGHYRFLSNFWPAKVKLDGQEYSSTEAAYQAAKTHDPEQRKKIREAPNAFTAKRFGKRVKLRADWDKVKYDIMLDLMRQKFRRKDLKDSLLETGDQKLIEGNYWHDNYWGDCYCPKCHDKSGRNALGEILMKVRDELSREEIDDEGSVRRTS